MSTGTPCPKCGGATTTETINYRLRAYCKHCGGLPYRDGKPETGRGHINSGEPRGPVLAQMNGETVQ